jgi:hypothetical protein
MLIQTCNLSVASWLNVWRWTPMPCISSLPRCAWTWLSRLRQSHMLRRQHCHPLRGEAEKGHCVSVTTESEGRNGDYIWWLCGCYVVTICWLYMTTISFRIWKVWRGLLVQMSAHPWMEKDVCWGITVSLESLTNCGKWRSFLKIVNFKDSTNPLLSGGILH